MLATSTGLCGSQPIHRQGAEFRPGEASGVSPENEPMITVTYAVDMADFFRFPIFPVFLLFNVTVFYTMFIHLRPCAKGVTLQTAPPVAMPWHEPLRPDQVVV